MKRIGVIVLLLILCISSPPKGAEAQQAGPMPSREGSNAGPLTPPQVPPALPHTAPPLIPHTLPQPIPPLPPSLPPPTEIPKEKLPPLEPPSESPALREEHRPSEQKPGEQKPVSPQKPHEASEIEILLSGKIPSDIPPPLKQFGYETFEETVSTFAPVTNVPVGPDYLIGPGDEFTVTLWGLVEGVHRVQVNRNGEITFPKVGVIPVSGLAFGDLKKYLERQLSRSFKDFHLNISMGNLRTIRVYLVGEVAHPGSYTVSSLSTVFNALFAAGGPSKKGSMRDIQLIREGKTIARLDLYDFLISGNKGQDRRLQDEDTIFVPLIGPVVGVAGSVYRPAIYEMKGPATLEDVIHLGGGIMPIGSVSRVQVERVVAHQKKIVVDFDLSSSSNFREKGGVQELQTAVQNMDVVKIFPINTVTQDIVYLKGHVVRPGGYQFKQGMRVTDIIRSHKDLLPEPYPEYAKIVRYVPPDLHQVVVPFHLGKALEGDPSENVELHSLDEVTIFSRESFEPAPKVTIEGEVRAPGTFPLVKEMRVADLIFAAGGFQKNAYVTEGELTRYSITQEGVTARIIPVDLEKAVAGDPVHNLPLQDFDHLSVRSIPELDLNQTVTLSGEVRHPGVYVIRRGERLSSVLKRAGGFTDKAFPKGMVFTRQSVRKNQEQQVKEFVRFQTQKLLAEANTIVVADLSKEEAAAEQKVLAQRKESVELLASQVPMGRVVIPMESLDTFEGSPGDLVLENGDSLDVPAQPSTVTVVGSVRNPAAILHQEGKKVEYYLQKAGGLMPDADQKGIYLIRADGSAATNFVKLRTLDPGDTIMVPSKVEVQYRPLPLFRDVMSIIGQTALTIAAMVAIF